MVERALLAGGGGTYYTCSLQEPANVQETLVMVWLAPAMGKSRSAGRWAFFGDHVEAAHLSF
ncbi:MAG: hypothetical protein JO041_08780 [Acidobacteria bacterium]|nr:hypothetical protein [Acidobacteriota bacterium]